MSILVGGRTAGWRYSSRRRGTACAAAETRCSPFAHTAPCRLVATLSNIDMSIFIGQAGTRKCDALRSRVCGVAQSPPAGAVCLNVTQPAAAGCGSHARAPGPGGARMRRVRGARHTDVVDRKGRILTCQYSLEGQAFVNVRRLGVVAPFAAQVWPPERLRCHVAMGCMQPMPRRHC